MPRELDELSTRELGERLRDEAFHLRVLTRELRNRATTLARAYDDSLGRTDALIAELERRRDPTPEEAHGHVASDRRNAHEPAGTR